jgi:hypothetical protein
MVLVCLRSLKYKLVWNHGVLKIGSFLGLRENVFQASHLTSSGSLAFSAIPWLAEILLQHLPSFLHDHPPGVYFYLQISAFHNNKSHTSYPNNQLNLIVSIKIHPWNKVIFWGIGVRTSTYEFGWGTPFSPLWRMPFTMRKQVKSWFFSLANDKDEPNKWTSE